MAQAKPEGMNWMTPYLTVADASAALDFYERAFGFARGETYPLPDGTGIGHASMTYQGTTVVMFSPEGAWSTHRTPAHLGIEWPINFYTYTPDVDALVERARQAGAKVLSEPQDAFWGERMASLADPDGYVWVFATPKG